MLYVAYVCLRPQTPARPHRQPQPEEKKPTRTPHTVGQVVCVGQRVIGCELQPRYPCLGALLRVLSCTALCSRALRRALFSALPVRELRHCADGVWWFLFCVNQFKNTLYGLISFVQIWPSTLHSCVSLSSKWRHMQSVPVSGFGVRPSY